MQKLKSKFILPLLQVSSLLVGAGAYGQQSTIEQSLSSLKNFQVNSDHMVSAGLPQQEEFETLKRFGVTRVIDLIPGDRSEEHAMLTDMGLTYFNVQVEWENPTLQNFKDYVHYMSVPGNDKGKTLTHCRLNWRGSAFTYLYRVTQLHEDKDVARQDMLSIWQPNETWQHFIEDVEAHYPQSEAR